MSMYTQAHMRKVYVSVLPLCAETPPKHQRMHPVPDCVPFSEALSQIFGFSKVNP